MITTNDIYNVCRDFHVEWRGLSSAWLHHLVVFFFIQYFNCLNYSPKCDELDCRIQEQKLADEKAKQHEQLRIAEESARQAFLALSDREKVGESFGKKIFLQSVGNSRCK